MKKPTAKTKAGIKIKTSTPDAAKKKKARGKVKSKVATKGVANSLKIPAAGSAAVRMAAMKKIERMDRPKKPAARAKNTKAAQPATALIATAVPQINGNFPNTYIANITVRLEDPFHAVTLAWAGPNAATQETGPFHSSPGAGLRGLNCDDLATSRRSGSACTPKGTFKVTGFASHLNSHPEATDVTWFVPERGIAFHFYPSVPDFAASHGCVRIESRRVAQLIQNNSKAGVTTVTVDGTWTKPAHQW